MGHIIFTGRTETGKTTAAMVLMAKKKEAGHKVAVLDPNLADWHCDHLFYDSDDFMEFVKNAESHYIVIDETGESLNKYDKTYDWLGTRSRHWGHRLCIITQRPALMSATIRTQCNELYLFQVNWKDAKVLAEEFNDKELNDAVGIPFYHYLFKKGADPIRKQKLRL